MASMEALAMSRPSSETSLTPDHFHLLAVERRNFLACSRRFSSPLPSSKRAAPSVLRSSFLCPVNSLQGRITTCVRSGKVRLSRLQVSSALIGEDPEWSEDDYVALGLSHCFQQVDSGSVKEVFLVEPVSASTLECLEIGGATSFLHVTGSTLGTALKFDVSLLPPEFAEGKFCENFDFRIKCASRTWKRPHAVNNLMSILPVGSLRSQYNFSLADKRIINKERVVTDADNIKQDMSIDVYGRASDDAKKEEASEIASLYNA